MKGLEFHEIAGLFPLMFGEEFAPFKNDIGDNGLLQPITLYEGKILDGRNRYKACLELDIEPKFEEYTGDKPVEYVLSKNLFRRHLSMYSKAKACLLLEPAWAEQAKEHQRAAGGDKRSKSYKLDVEVTKNSIKQGLGGTLYKNSNKPVESIDAVDKVCKLLKISRDSFYKGKYIVDTLKKKVENGTMSQKEANKIDDDLRNDEAKLNKIWTDLKNEENKNLEKEKKLTYINSCLRVWATKAGDITHAYKQIKCWENDPHLKTLINESNSYRWMLNNNIRNILWELVRYFGKDKMISMLNDMDEKIKEDDANLKRDEKKWHMKCIKKK